MDEAKAVAGSLVKLESALDAEYLKSVPPFKPTALRRAQGQEREPGRGDGTVHRRQCPPCVAADAAFDGLLKTYKPTDVVLIQYHVHIPGPDPLTIPDTVARFDYYRKEFPEAIRGAPTSVFNGKPQAGGGGEHGRGREQVQPVHGRDRRDAGEDDRGEDGREGDADRRQDRHRLEVTEGAGDDMRLRLLVVEESIRYVGSNQMRFHHHVVRAMPGGAEGVAIKDKAFKHTAATDLAEVRKELTKYLDEFAQDASVPEAGPADGDEGAEGDRDRAERQDEGDRSGRADRGRGEGRGRRALISFECPSSLVEPRCDTPRRGFCSKRRKVPNSSRRCLSFTRPTG